MARKRRGATRSRSSGVKNQVWTALLLSGQTFDDAPVIEFPIVEETDWKARGGFEHATLLRIRGWLTFQPPAIVPSTALMCIGVVDNGVGATSLNPNDVATYTREDILWTSGISMANSGVANDVMNNPIEVDVKAMRRITNAQEVRISFVSGGPVAATWTVNGVLRALVRMGGN